MNALASIQLVTLDDDLFALQSTASGRLMARYCVAFDTMKNFHAISGAENMNEMVSEIMLDGIFHNILGAENMNDILREFFVFRILNG